jgi:hypothetical protein
MVDLCEQSLEKLPAECHHFIRDMVAYRDRFSDNLWATPKQQQYLRLLISRYKLITVEDVNDKPKSKLQLLREKRDKLISTSAKRAKKERKRERLQFQTMSALAGGELRVSDAPTARIKHDKTVHAANFTEPTGRKRRVAKG